MTVTVSFPQPAKRMSMNDRTHWRKRAELTKVWRNAAYVSGWSLGRCFTEREQPPCMVRVSFPVPDPKRRRDPHNTAPTVKAIIDGLVDAGCWPDDTDQYVIVLDPRFHHNGQVEVELIPRVEGDAA